MECVLMKQGGNRRDIKNDADGLYNPSGVERHVQPWFKVRDAHSTNV